MATPVNLHNNVSWEFAVHWKDLQTLAGVGSLQHPSGPGIISYLGHLCWWMGSGVIWCTNLLAYKECLQLQRHSQPSHSAVVSLAFLLFFFFSSQYLPWSLVRIGSPLVLLQQAVILAAKRYSLIWRRIQEEGKQWECGCCKKIDVGYRHSGSLPSHVTANLGGDSSVKKKSTFLISASGCCGLARALELLVQVGARRSWKVCEWIEE